MGRIRAEIASVLLLSAVCNVLVLASPIYMLQVYDRVLPSGSLFALGMLSLIVGALYALTGLLDAYRGQALVFLGAKLECHLAPKVHRAVFGSLPAAGISRVAFREMDELVAFITTGRVCPYLDLPWSPLFVSCLFLMSPWLGALACVGIAAISILAAFGAKSSDMHAKQNRKIQLLADRVLDESIANLPSVIAMGMRPALEAAWNVQRTGHLRGQIRAGLSASAIGAGSRAIRVGLQSAALGVGAWLAVTGEISAGMMVASSIIMGRALSPVDQITATWRDAAGARRSWAQLRNRLNANIDEPDKATTMHVPSGAQLDCRIVACSPQGWKAQTAALNGIGFILDAGDVLGVVGPSGAGKTTLLQALSGVLPVFEGEITIGGIPSIKWRGRKGVVGYLSQDIGLFTGTIQQNIVGFNVGDGDGRLLTDALALAGADRFVGNLADGLSTLLGPGGSGLSAGQRQCIGLARAVYGNPAIVVLDEPNANLDEAGRDALLACIRELSSRGTTVIVTTHQVSLLTVTTKILSLRSGRVLRFGKTDGVIAQQTTSPGKGAIAKDDPSVGAPAVPQAQMEASP